MLIPVALPPGIVKNGTSYQRRGRWVDSNLIRWYEGAIRPIGGWLPRTKIDSTTIPALIANPALEAIRDGHAWTSLSQDQNVVFGSNLKLYHLSQTGTVTDITPGTMVTTGKDASLQAGYGQNPYGVGGYGVLNTLVSQAAIPPNRWAFDHFGEILLACQNRVGPLYEVNPATLAVTVVPNAPSACQDVIVTNERTVMTIGAGGNTRLVSWSDQEDRTLWAAAIDNQAGDYTLAGSGRLLRLINVLKQVLILGENDASVAQYVGPPYVYSFELVGRNCGPAMAGSVVGTERFAVWWGANQFWLFDGAIQELPCSVIEFLEEDVDPVQVSKISAFSNHAYSEVWWFYQCSASTTGDLDSYVTWNYSTNIWTTGRLARTAGIDAGTLTSVIMVTPAGVIMNHEQRGLAVDGTPFVRSGFIDMSNGERNIAVRYIYPDSEDFGDIDIKLWAKQFPTGAVDVYGPYAYNNPTAIRVLGRSIAFHFTLNSALSEVGTMRLDVAPSGGGQR